MEGITKKDIKAIKGLIGDREQEICIKEYGKCNDKNVREVQKNDKKLIALEKALGAMYAVQLIENLPKK